MKKKAAKKKAKKKFTPKAIKVVREIDPSIASPDEDTKATIRKMVREEVKRALRASR